MLNIDYNLKGVIFSVSAIAILRVLGVRSLLGCGDTIAFGNVG
ncbi:MAG: hypothetical protein ACLBM6_19155 [Cuspidothrix sp.]